MSIISTAAGLSSRKSYRLHEVLYNNINGYSHGRPSSKEARALSRLSVIVPALNEEKILRRTLASLVLSSEEELIVVDGGSTDGTVRIATEFTDKVFVAGRGRARQMNHGAGKAVGDLLLFLHADCVPPKGGFTLIRRALSEKGVSAGAFDLAIEHRGLRFRAIELGANLRSRLTSIAYGDQGMFMTREVFERSGGFADIPLMEDVELSARLRKMGRIAFVRPPIRTLPRRWLAEGALYATLRDWSLAFSYAVLKTPPARLAKFYRDVR
jgi:rSAM/selenodomain-associated transferase 2